MSGGKVGKIPARVDLIGLAEQTRSIQGLADLVGVPRVTLRDHLRREGLLDIVKGAMGQHTAADRAGVRIAGDEAHVTSPPSPEARTPEEVMRARDLDPADWEVASLVVNEWDAPGPEGEVRTMRQLKLTLRRRKALAFVTPAIEVEYEAPRAWRRVVGGTPELVVVVSDQQAPYQDPRLHELFRRWLIRNQPHRGVLAGDTLDFPTISRHRDNPEWHVGAQECLNSGYLMLRDYVRASEGTRWTKLMGNHDERLRTELLNRAERMYGIRPADVPDEPQAPQALSLRHLLHLDSLGIEVEEPRGNYTHAQVTLSDQLMVRHGWKTSPSAAKDSLKQLDCSILVAHTHRQTKASRAVYGAKGELLRTLSAHEIGCMCRIEGGLGYAVDPDWMNGFATVSLWPDGRFQVDLAQYESGVLTWRKQRYEA